MIKPNELQARALKNLEGNSNWETITDWVKDSWIRQSVKNNHSKGEEAIKMQGRCLELEDLLNHIMKADDYRLNALDAKRMEKGG